MNNLYLKSALSTVIEHPAEGTPEIEMKGSDPSTSLFKKTIRESDSRAGTPANSATTSPSKRKKNKSRKDIPGQLEKKFKSSKSLTNLLISRSKAKDEESGNKVVNIICFKYSSDQNSK